MEVYYCPKCEKWRGRNKVCPVCKTECVLSKLPKTRANAYFIKGVNRPLARVTNILQLVLAQPGLQDWITKQAVTAALENPRLSIDEAMNARFVKRDEAGKAGTRIHKLVEGIFSGEKPSPEDEKLPKFKGYRKFEKDIPRKVLASELTVYSEEMGYAGTADEISEVGEDAVLLDYKTGKSVFLAKEALQFTAYKMAIEEMVRKGKLDMPIPKRLFTVHLKEYTFSYIERPYVPEVWKAVLTIYNFLYND